MKPEKLNLPVIPETIRDKLKKVEGLQQLVAKLEEYGPLSADDPRAAQVGIQLAQQALNLAMPRISGLEMQSLADLAAGRRYGEMTNGQDRNINLGQP